MGRTSECREKDVERNARSCQAQSVPLALGEWPYVCLELPLSLLYPSRPRASSLGLIGREVRPYECLKPSKSLSSARLGCYCDQIAFEFPIHLKENKPCENFF